MKPSPETHPVRPLVVGTVHSHGALKRALRLRAGQVDILELRVDAFAGEPDFLLRAASRMEAPLLVTVRHPREGGGTALSLAQRRLLIRKFLPIASWLDVEVRSLGYLESEIFGARSLGVRLIVSDHHFTRTPPVSFLRKRVRLSAGVNPDVFKLATFARDLVDLERLMAFLREGPRGGRAVMGMGPYGKASRLLLGRCGSCLNYGYLDTPQVPGQWEATVLKERLGELFGEGE